MLDQFNLDFSVDGGIYKISGYPRWPYQAQKVYIKVPGPTYFSTPGLGDKSQGAGMAIADVNGDSHDDIIMLAYMIVLTVQTVTNIA